MGPPASTASTGFGSVDASSRGPSPDDDIDARSAVFLGFPVQVSKAAITKWFERLGIELAEDVKLQCRLGALSARLEFPTRARCQVWMAEHEGPYKFEINNSLCTASAMVNVKQSKPLEKRGRGRLLAPIWKEVNDHLAQGGEQAKKLRCQTDAPRNMLNVLHEDGTSISVFRLEGEGAQSRDKVLADFPSANKHQMEQMAARPRAVAVASGVFASG